jgi:dolichol-phosphate mannosyltransferase
VFNEEEVIANVVDELRRDIIDHFEDAEIVFVDDASTDGTPRILDELAAEDPRIRVIHAERNSGHGPSVRRALGEATGDWLFQIDSDEQQVPEEFWKLWERRGGAGLVMGMRVIRRNGRHRLVISAAARYMHRLAGGGDVRDVNVPFKLIRRSLWEDVSTYLPAAPIQPSLLIALGAAIRGWRIVQVPITHKQRPNGPSRQYVNLGKLAKLTARSLREFLAFRSALARAASREEPVRPRARSLPA